MRFSASFAHVGSGDGRRRRSAGRRAAGEARGVAERPDPRHRAGGDEPPDIEAGRPRGAKQAGTARLETVDTGRAGKLHDDVRRAEVRRPAAVGHRRGARQPIGAAEDIAMAASGAVQVEGAEDEGRDQKARPDAPPHRGKTREREEKPRAGGASPGLVMDLPSPGGSHWALRHQISCPPALDAERAPKGSGQTDGLSPSRTARGSDGFRAEDSGDQATGGARASRGWWEAPDVAKTKPEGRAPLRMKGDQDAAATRWPPAVCRRSRQNGHTGRLTTSDDSRWRGWFG